MIDVRPGDVLAGKYRVDGVIGAGAMGVVVAAHHLQLDERVALKFLLPAALDNPQAMARFAREARATVKIKSEHVPRVSDVGTLENGAPYIVMEFLEGIDLSTWLQTKGPLPVGQAVEFLLQACEAVAEAHACGIIHRDLKPANLFVAHRNDGEPTIKVLDFGISKMSQSDGDLAGTSTHTVIGSPCYMSPEQMSSSRDVTAQSDIWALGVILFELLTGELPFAGDTLPAVCLQVTSEPPRALGALLPTAPAEIEAVIARCLEKERSSRFQDVAELSLALYDVASKRGRASIERILRIANRRDVARGDASGARKLLPAEAARHSLATGAGRNPLATETMAPYGRTTGAWRRGPRRLTTVATVAAAIALVISATAMRRGVLSAVSSVVSSAVSIPRGESSHQAAAVAPIPEVHLAPAPPEPSTAAPPIPMAPLSTFANAEPTEPATEPSAEPTPTSAGATSLHRRALATPRPTPVPMPPPRAITSPVASRPIASAPPQPASPGVTHDESPPQCDPPFFFDDTGIRVFKKECVH